MAVEPRRGCGYQAGALLEEVDDDLVEAAE
jgi:hypothetical protein